MTPGPGATLSAENLLATLSGAPSSTSSPTSSPKPKPATLPATSTYVTFESLGVPKPKHSGIPTTYPRTEKAIQEAKDALKHAHQELRDATVKLEASLQKAALPVPAAASGAGPAKELVEPKATDTEAQSALKANLRNLAGAEEEEGKKGVGLKVTEVFGWNRS